MMPTVIILLILVLIEQLLIRYFTPVVFKNGISIKSKSAQDEDLFKLKLFKEKNSGLEVEGNEIYYFSKDAFRRFHMFIVFGKFNDTNLKFKIKIPFVFFISMVIIQIFLIVESLTKLQYVNILFVVVLNLFLYKEYLGTYRRFKSLIEVK